MPSVHARLIVLVPLVLAVAAAGCGTDDLGLVASDMCPELAESPQTVARQVDTGLTELARLAGQDADSSQTYDQDDLGDALVEQCPEDAEDALELLEIGQDACQDLDGAIVMQVASILGRAVSDAEDIGFEGPDVGNVMRYECPSSMAAVERIGDDQGQREQDERARDLEEQRMVDEIDTEIDKCTFTRSEGLVRNNNGFPVVVSLEVTYTRSGDVLVERSSDTVRLDANQTGEWSTYAPDEYDNCSLSVESVRRQ